VPVSIAGKTVGVLRAAGADGAPPVRDAVESLELVARKAGERIGVLRAFARSETQARTDALTGLLNRRSLEIRLRELTDEGEPYVVAFGDLDHFKLLNDVHGHDAGDRALRMFARVLRDNVRPKDATARYGGEEFVIVLPDCSIPDAQAVLERIRDQLAAVQQHGTVPPFTVSFGVATSRPDLPYDEVIETADQALLQAKASGRDRVIVAGTTYEAEAPAPAEATNHTDGAHHAGAPRA
jgi:diguanylate cyclase (GGDEF)-like protein